MLRRPFPSLCAFLLLIYSSLAWGDSKDASGSQTSGRKLILAVGISHFEDSRWNTLRFAHDDAQAVFDLFRAQGFSGQLLVSSPGHAVTRARVIEALRWLADENRREDDMIVVYFSGHGTVARTQDSENGREVTRKFMVTSDSRWDDVAGTGLAQDHSLRIFNAMSSRKKAFLIDSCYSGGGKAQLNSKMLAFLASQKSGQLQEPVDDVSEGSAVYAASAWGEEAQESEALRHGVYTHFLLEAIAARVDVDGDGATRLSEAHLFATNRVIEFTRGGQHPSALINAVGRDPIIVRGRAEAAGAPILTAWSWGQRKWDAFINGKKAGTLSKGFLALPSERVHLELVDPVTGRRLASRYVEFLPGEERSVSELLQEDRPYAVDGAGRVRWFLGPSARERVASVALMGGGLRLIREDLLAGSDLWADYTYFPWQHQRVTLAESLGPQLRQRVVDSHVRLHGMRLGIAHRWSLAVLTSVQGRRNVELDAATAPELLLAERRFSGLSEEATRELSGQVSLVGWMAAVGLKTRWPQLGFRLGMDVELAVLPNRLGTSDAALGLLGLTFSSGLQW